MDDALFTLESEFSAVESEYGVLDDSATTVGYHTEVKLPTLTVVQAFSGRISTG